MIKKCCICGKEFAGFGNNAEPIMKRKDVKDLTFNERAKLFKEAVMKAEKKYGVAIVAGYINSWDDAENLLIQEYSDVEVINEVYFNTLEKEL
jgi:hypothetical protein